MAKKWRQIKFDIIERFLLPVGILVLKSLAFSWRIDEESREMVRQYGSRERAVIATFHGMPFPLLRLGRLFAQGGGQACVLTSPSRDGRLMDAIVRSFGYETVQGSSSSKAISGSRAMIQAAREGLFGIVSIDGPKGPVTVPKPGILRIARASDAVILTVVASGRPAITFGSWDRLFLPLPFARIRLYVRPFEWSADEEEGAVVKRLHRQLLEDGRRVECQIVEGIELTEEEL